MHALTKLLLTAVAGTSIAIAQANHHSRMVGEEYDSKTDLASLLQKPPIKQHERLTEALQILNTVQSAPRCHYNAALSLLNDCKFLETKAADSSTDSETNLEKVETVYAARLAVCELQSAHADIPFDCKVVTASAEACVKKRGLWFSRQEKPKEDRLCYVDAPDPKQFKRCLKALNAKSQYWTSYSNARQNAVVMCHASRDIIEKEKNLEHYASLGDAVSQMAAVLTEYEEKIKLWHEEIFARVEKIRTSSELALQDSEDNRANLEAVKTSLRSLQGIMTHMAETLSQEVQESVAKSRNDMEQHREELNQQHQEAKQQHHEMIELNAQQASAQRTDMEKNHEVVVSAVQSYQNTAMSSLQAVFQTAALQFADLANKTEIRMEKLQAQLDEGSTKMDNISQGLDRFNVTVNALHEATATLPEMLQTLTSIGGTFGNLKYWIIPVASLLALWKIHEKLASYCTAFGGLAWSLYMVDVRFYAKAFGETVISGFHSSHPIVLIVLGLAFIFLLSFLAHKYTRLAYLFEYVDEKGRKFALPRIESPAPPGARNRKERPITEV